MRSNPSPCRSTRSPSLRGLSIAGAVGVLLLLIAPGMGATVPGVSVTPPFHGSSALIVAFHHPGGPSNCGDAGFGHHPGWHAKTGVLNWSGGASLRSSAACIYPILFCGKNSTCAYSDIALTVPIPTPLGAGTHNVSAHWTMRANDSWSLVHHPCPSAVLTNGSGYQACSMLIRVFVYESFVYLSDLTNGTSFYINHSSFGSFSFVNQSSYFHDESCVSHVCHNRTFASLPASGSSSVSQSLVDTWSSIPTNSTHRYELYYRFLGGVTTSFYVAGQPWSASTRGWMDVNSGGNGHDLTLISIS